MRKLLALILCLLPAFAFAQSSTWPSIPLQTGQTTQYNSLADDGYYQKGQAKAYTILTAGQYSGTTNINLAQYTSGAGAITFSNVAHTIVDTGSGLAQFLTSDVIMTSSASNPGPFTITTGGVAGTITCTGATFVNETPAGAVTFYKQDNKTNNCVLDNRTGLMWTKYRALHVGVASDGQMPFYSTASPYNTTTPYWNIFTYAAAANTANLAGYTDWRVPNFNELSSIAVLQAPNGNPNGTAFPTPPGNAWTSTTEPGATTYGLYWYFSTGSPATAIKTVVSSVYLVRGAN